MEKERYLFRAGADGCAHPQILEVRRGSVRLLTPSGVGRRVQHTVATLLSIGYVFGGSSVIASGLGVMIVFTPLTGIVALALFFGGLIALLLWWDRQSLPILAENPAAAVPLGLVSIQSYGTLVEVRARAGSEELRISIPGSKRHVEEGLGVIREGFNAMR